MKRREDWMTQLYKCIDDARLLPFQYGLHDCCLWAAHCIDSMCDTSFVRDVQERLNYHSLEDATAAINAAGGFERLVNSFLGEAVSGKLAAPGDVVMAQDAEDRLVVGVVVGHQVMAPSVSGLLALPYSSVRACWKI